MIDLAVDESFRTLVQFMPVGMVMVNAAGSIMLVNTAAETMFGYEPGELLGRPVEALVPQRHGAAHSKYRRSYLNKPQPRPMGVGRDLHARRKDGFEFPVEIALTPIETRDGVYIIGAIADITERREKERVRLREQQLRALSAAISAAEDRERERLAADLHDEIGQLLAMSKMNLDRIAEAMGGSAAPSELDDCRRLIEKAVEATRSLSFSLSSPTLTRLGLGAAIRELCVSLEKRKGPRFVCAWDDRIGRLVPDQERLLYRTIRELLFNIVKHAQASRASVIADRRAGEVVHISVEDNGKGFDLEQIGYAFSPTGGFGLFHIRERLYNAGGVLEIASDAGRGTRAKIVLPIEADTNSRQDGEVT